MPTSLLWPLMLSVRWRKYQITNKPLESYIVCNFHYCIYILIHDYGHMEFKIGPTSYICIKLLEHDYW